MASDLSQLIRQVKGQGFTVEDTSGGHIRVTNPEGQIVILHSTRAEGRAIPNAVAQLKRIGYNPRPKAPVTKRVTKAITCAGTPLSDKVEDMAVTPKPKEPTDPESNGKTVTRRSPAFRCRECGHSIKEVPILAFPHKTIPSPSSICVDCATKLMDPGQTLRDFVYEYVEANTDPLILAKRKIKDLEERLALANKTIQSLNPSHR